MAAFWTSDKQILAKKKTKLTHYDLIRRTNELLPEYQLPMIRRVGEAKLSPRAQLAKCRALGDNRWRVIIIPICMLKQNFFFFLCNYGARCEYNCLSRRLHLFFCCLDTYYSYCCCNYRAAKSARVKRTFDPHLTPHYALKVCYSQERRRSKVFSSLFPYPPTFR